MLGEACSVTDGLLTCRAVPAAAVNKQEPGYQISRPVLQASLPPTRLHPLEVFQLPQNTPPVGDQVLRHRSLWGLWTHNVALTDWPTTGQYVLRWKPSIYLIFLPMGSSTVAVTCRNCLGVSGHVSCPVHSDTSIIGYQPRPMDMFSKWDLRSCLEGLWSLLEVLNGPTWRDSWQMEFFVSISKTSLPPQPGVTMFRLIKVHLQVFCA